MFIRVISGRVKAGSWSDYETAYKRAMEDAGPINGLVGRWLTKDLDDPDAGTTISLWATAEAMRAYEASEVLAEVIQPKLQPYFTGEYRTSRAGSGAEGGPVPANGLARTADGTSGKPKLSVWPAGLTEW